MERETLPATARVNSPYAKRVEASQNGFLTSAVQALGVGQMKVSKWRIVAVLEFVDGDGESLWKFPIVGAFSDLLDAVQYRVAGVNEFLAEIEALAS